MTRVAVGSAFRDCAHSVMRYVLRVASLKIQLGPDYDVRIIAVEGDSSDTTRQALLFAAACHNVQIDLRTCNHGRPWFGSVVSEDRMTNMSKVGNAIFDGVAWNDDVLLYVESDLLWEPDMAAELVRSAAERRQGFDVISPTILAGPNFYDIWAFRKVNGEGLSPFLNDHPVVNDGDIYELGSVGSCLAMRGDVARACRIRDNNCLVGWCADARSQGYRIGYNPALIVRHP